MKLSGDIQTFAARLGHAFSRPELLARALTHASIATPNRPDNQRLEFLGDRVLGLVMAEALLANRVQWGVIEEITSTYVVVKLWDWRRMILPLTYFIQKPFQNWTRETSRLIGTAFLYVDYEAPIERLRAELERVCRASPFWDGDVVNLQVTEVTDRVAQVRCLASARNAPTAFDLRCEIREKMLAFMRDECPEALPKQRQLNASADPIS